MDILSHKLQLFTLLGIMALPAMAAEERPIIDILELTDGTVLKGYIMEKSNADGIKFQSFDATFTLPEKAIKRRKNNKIDYASLHLYWQNWIENNNVKVPQNGQFVISTISLNKEVSDSDYVEILNIKKADSFEGYQLAIDQDKHFGKREEAGKKHSDKTISEKEDTKVHTDKNFREFFKEKNFSIIGLLPDVLTDVHVMESGAYFKIVDLKPASYSLPWNAIRKISKTERDDLQINGINDEIVKIDNSKISGIIFAQVPGKYVYLKNNDTEEVAIIRMSEIRQQNRIAMSTEQSIIEQSPLIETILTANGESIKGIITSQVYKTKSTKEPKLITITQSDGQPVTIEASTLKGIKYSLNPDYHPLMDVMLENDSDIVINGIHTHYAEIFSEETRVYTFDFDDQVSLCKKDMPEEGILNLYVSENQPNEDFSLIYCCPMMDKKGNGVYAKGFSFKGLQALSVHSEISVTPHGCRLYKFKVPKTGWFMLYQSVSEKGIMVEIK